MLEQIANFAGMVLVPAACVGQASLAGYWLAQAAPWRDEARHTPLPLAAGLVLGPFILGLISVMLLALPFEKSRSFFLYAPLLILSLPAVMGLRCLLRRKSRQSTEPLLGLRLLYLICFFWVVALLFNASTYVLTQNDALEYAMVGRLLFETGSLASYPAISPETTADGFYGPWTHPPLYVALIALSNFIQGHADTPGLMRLIAPWFLLVACYATWALGSFFNRRIGALAAIIVISTPLLFLGSDSALLDALTVASFTLLMAALCGLDFRADTLRSGASLGLVIGLGMWAHSQTILYLPVGLFVLGIMHGVRPGWGYWHIAGIAVLTALAIASPPYLRNLAVMGTLISDEPAVFALEVLDWRGYFDFARGLDHPIALIQYGLFKGWFSLEAYGLSYWFLTLGLSFALAGNAFPLEACFRPHKLRRDMSALLLWTACALFASYFAGTLLSVLLGMNLMIKNERYLLTTLPAVAVIGAYGIERFSILLTARLLNAHKGWRDTVLACLLTAEVFALSSFLIVGFYYRFRLLPPAVSAEINWDEADLSVLEDDGKLNLFGKSFDSERAFQAFPSIQSVQFMNATLPQDALILASRPADFYYLERRMISYLDLRLLDVYGEKDPARAAQMLRDIGVTHIHMVDYALPPFYNSALSQVIADPSLTSLVYDNSFFQVYALEPSGKTTSELATFTPEPEQDGLKWATRTQYVLGGRKAFLTTGGEFTLLDDSALSQTTLPLFHRDYTTFLMPTMLNRRGLRIPLFFDIVPGQEYVVEFELEGHGFLRVWAEIYSDDNGVLRTGNENPRMRIYETVLNEHRPSSTVIRRFKAAPWAEKIVFQIEHLGRSNLRIISARLQAIEP